VEVLKHWLQFQTGYNIKLISKDVFLINDNFILKRFLDKNKFLREITVLTSIESANFLIPRIYLTINNRIFVKTHKGYFYLQEYFNTEKLDSERLLSNSSICIGIGQAIADMHIMLESISHNKIFNKYSLVSQIERSFKGKLQNHLSLTQKFYKQYLDKALRFDDLPKQLIHRDIHLGNIIYNDKQYGFIDYALVEQNHKVFDICYLCTSLLIEFDISIEELLTVLERCLKGYFLKSFLREDELNAIPEMILSILYIATDYFLRNNDYEELAQKNINAISKVEKSFDRLETFINKADF
jgi:Ser/Thr protein kinase RdoA (MazF antagonist)